MIFYLCNWDCVCEFLDDDHHGRLHEMRVLRFCDVVAFVASDVFADANALTAKLC